MVDLPARVLENYDLVRELGVGGQGHTVLARRRSNGEDVVLKTLDFVQLSSWKDLELLQREMRVLRSLDHPAVPNLYEWYPEDVESEQPDVFVVVQEFVDGEPLDVLLRQEEGPIMNETEARSFLAEMLPVLEYLHGLNPPVVHRDIKPSNIIRRSDGRHSLIDFGAARASGVNTGSSTFVGTNGYMPPEQLMGRSEPRSDLFALGATTLELLTGIEPSNLADSDLSFRLEHVSVGPELRSFLAILTHPRPEMRYRSATRARQALEQPSGALLLGRDSWWGFEVERTADGRVVAELPMKFAQPVWLFLLIALFFVALGFFFDPMFFWLSLLGWFLFGLQAQSLRVELDGDELRWRRRFAGLGWKRRVALKELTDASVETIDQKPAVFLQKRDGQQLALRAQHLDPSRAEWLAGMITNHLEGLP